MQTKESKRKPVKNDKKHGPIFFNNFFTRIKNTNHAHKAENRPINRVGNEGKRPETHNTTIRH